jgi:hypothetical protein
MTADVISFRGNKTKDPQKRQTLWGRPYVRREKTMHTLVFRSREAILEADEAQLFEDVCYDLDKAQRKLEAARLQLEKVQEHAAAEVQELTAVIAKLGAAVVGAVLTRRGQR